MKIEPGRPASGVHQRAPRGGEQRASGAFAAHLGAPSARSASGAMPVNPLGALLALQEVDDPLQGRRRARERGGRLLDMLDEVRTGLLTGAIPQAVLGELARLAGEARDSVDDPGLAAVLDEIDLRAQVELAKLQMRS
ncbi:MAG: flagellar assembly protein FliX [Alphaproteobacteria bacterium]